MGLDTYARNDITITPPDGEQSGSLTPEQSKAFQDAGINLCGGMFSGNGNDGSFRGKVYYKLVKDATGVDLYQEWIEPAVVEDMAQKMTDYLEDVENLQKFLLVCADNGLGLVGWW